MENQKIFLLVDFIYNNDFFLPEKLREKGFDVEVIDIPNYTMKDRTVKFRILLMYYKYIIQSLKALSRSQKNDIIICWNFTTGIAMGFVSRLLFKKRKILALNIIAHSSKGIISLIRKSLFHYAMNQRYFFITANSNDYTSENSERFKISKDKFHVLPDPVKEELPYNITVKNTGCIFCGGEAQRDWDMFFKLAISLPEYRFVGIARKKHFTETQYIPDNTKLLFDVDYEIFLRYMACSDIIILPLKSTFPCGLIVIGDAGIMKKAVIASRTPSTSNYILHGKTGVLVDIGDFHSFKKEIVRLMNDIQIRNSLGDNLSDFLREYFSQDAYVKKLKTILEICFIAGKDHKQTRKNNLRRKNK